MQQIPVGHEVPLDAGRQDGPRGVGMDCNAIDVVLQMSAPPHIERRQVVAHQSIVLRQEQARLPHRRPRAHGPGRQQELGCAAFELAHQVMAHGPGPQPDSMPSHPELRNGLHDPSYQSAPERV